MLTRKTMAKTAILLLACGAAYAAAVDDLALYELIGKDDMDGLAKQLDEYPKLLNKVPKGAPGGQSPLMHSVLSGKNAAVELLLARGADTTIGEKDGYTPLHGAGFQGRAKIMKMLIAHGLDPNDYHTDGYTPLHRACWGGEPRHTQTVKVLLEAGVDPSQPSLREGQQQLPVEMARRPQTKALLEESIGEYLAGGKAGGKAEL